MKIKNRNPLRLLLVLAITLALLLGCLSGCTETKAQPEGAASSASQAQSASSTPAEESEGTVSAPETEPDALPAESASASFGDLSVGDQVTLGTYDGTPLTWTVITKDVGTALVLCDKVLERTTFGEGNDSWKDSDVCKYLNREFFATVFSSEERSQIVKSQITTTLFDGDSYSTVEEQSEAWVFLLSAREFLLYVTPLGDLCYGVPLESIKDDVYMADVSNSESVEQACGWELRDDGEQESYNIMSVDGWDGRVSGYGTGKKDQMSIRPAMWIYTDQALAERYLAGEAELPADEALDASLASLHTGDQVSFGRFCDRDYRDGNQDIQWTVLDETDDALLLCANGSFGIEQFSQSEDEEVNWSASYLRERINSDQFIGQYFNPWEREKIQTTHLTTSNGDPEWDRSGGPETDDRLFVLDREELLRYCPEEADRALPETSYWLRNPNFAPGWFECVNYEGSITTDDATSRHDIRPAMWVAK